MLISFRHHCGVVRKDVEGEERGGGIGAWLPIIYSNSQHSYFDYLENCSLDQQLLHSLHNGYAIIDNDNDVVI